jgi:hypothetical protein
MGADRAAERRSGIERAVPDEEMMLYAVCRYSSFHIVRRTLTKFYIH